MAFCSGIFQHPTDNYDYFNLISGQRHSTARFLCPSGNSDSIIIGAGTCDDSSNTVGVWSLTNVLECQQNEKLLSDFDGYKVGASVSCLEFCQGNVLPNLCPLWVGLVDGTVILLGNNITSMDDDRDIQQKLIQNAVFDNSRPNLHSAAVSAIAVHPNEEQCLTAAEDGKLFELRVDGAGSVTASPWPEVIDWMAVYDVKYGGDGRTVYTAGGSGQIKMWDRRACSRPKSFGGEDLGDKYFSIEPFDRTDAGGMGARDGLLLAGGADGRISVFDVRQERTPLIQILPGSSPDAHSAEVLSIRGGHQGAFRRSFYSCAADGSVLALAGDGGGGGAGGFGSDPAPISVTGWYRRAQAVNSVDAVLCDEGRRGERTLLLAATDGGLLLAQVPADPGAPLDCDGASDALVVEEDPGAFSAAAGAWRY
jgi:WD40 repeat protein